MQAHVSVTVGFLGKRLGTVHARAARMLRLAVCFHRGEVSAVDAAQHASRLFRHRRGPRVVLATSFLVVVIVVKHREVVYAAVTRR